MKRPTYVVLGSNSFSGGWMVDTLMEYYPKSTIIGISRSPEKSELFLPYRQRHFRNFQFHQLDLLRHTKKLLALLDAVQADYIINFAAQGEVATSWKYPDQYYKTNALGIVAFTHALREKPYLKRYIHISTPEVYGTCKGVKENAPLDPSTPYAASKAAGDLFLSTLFKQYRFPLITIRSTNVYGKHQQLYRIIPRTIIFLKMGRQIPLHGGGKAIKSYVHIKDVCRGIIAAMEKGKIGTIYHFSPSESISIYDLVSRICTLMEYNPKEVISFAKERPGQDAHYSIDSSKARRQLAWKPAVPFTQGLQEVIDWIEQNYKKILKEPLEYRHRP